jgi:hypothetical protein
MAIHTESLAAHGQDEADAASKARTTLLEKIEKLAGATTSSSTVLMLAEAYAYVVNPGAAHGPTVNVKS